MKTICKKVRRIIKWALWEAKKSVAKKSINFVEKHLQHCPACRQWFEKEKTKFALSFSLDLLSKNKPVV